MIYKFKKTPLNYSELDEELSNAGLTGTLVGISTCKYDKDYNIEITWKDTGESDTTKLSNADESTQITTVSNHTPDALQILKDKLNTQIDRKAFKRFQILLTFAYDSKSFSLSSNAQQKIAHYYNEKDSLSYPTKFATKNNRDKISIANSTEMTNFYNAMVGDFITEMDLIQTTKSDVNGAVDSDSAITYAESYINL